MEGGEERGEPRLWHGFYWRAWACLKGDRQYGAFGGEGPMSFIAIERYARRYCIDGVDFETFLHLMMALDAEWLEFVAREAAKKAPPQSQ